MVYTICPGSSDQFYIVSYCIKWVTTSWTHGTFHLCDILGKLSNFYVILEKIWGVQILSRNNLN